MNCTKYMIKNFLIKSIQQINAQIMSQVFHTEVKLNLKI